MAGVWDAVFVGLAIAGLARPARQPPYCMGGGPIDTGDACGAAYVGRYVSLTLLVCVVVVQVRTKINRRHTSLGEPYPSS